MTLPCSQDFCADQVFSHHYQILSHSPVMGGSLPHLGSGSFQQRMYVWSLKLKLSGLLAESSLVASVHSSEVLQCFKKLRFPYGKLLAHSSNEQPGHVNVTTLSWHFWKWLKYPRRSESLTLISALSSESCASAIWLARSASLFSSSAFFCRAVRISTAKCQ